MPSEALGGTHPRSFDDKTTLRSFRANSAISFSFSYEMQVTTMQIARSYLRMFRGLGAELRLVRQLEVDGELHDVPPKQDTGPHFRPAVLDAVRRGMVDVVDNDEHATGRFVHELLMKERGLELHGLVGGKTGTAVSNAGTRDGKAIHLRNASFVGFLPADKPRWLAVCVLQNDGASQFYGGRYAAPPAVKLLLECQALAERQPLHQDLRLRSGGQTRDVPSGTELRSPGSSGWDTPVGTGASRDTR